MFKTRLGRIGIVVCWDLAFPELTKKLALNGAEVIFCPSFWCYEDKYGMLTDERKHEVPEIDTESIFIDSCVQARAIENEVAFVYINGWGEFRRDRYTINLLGRTQVAIPFYGRVSMAEGEELLITDVDTEMLSLAEEVYRIREDTKLLD